MDVYHVVKLEKEPQPTSEQVFLVYRQDAPSLIEEVAFSSDPGDTGVLLCEHLDTMGNPPCAFSYEPTIHKYMRSGEGGRSFDSEKTILLGRFRVRMMENKEIAAFELAVKENLQEE